VLLNDRPVRPRAAVQGGERVLLRAVFENEADWRPQPLALNVIHADTDLIVIDKPAGVVVHPGAGNRDATLANALLHFDPELANLPRAGIVHRIDKDTSGLLVVARSMRAHTLLTRQLQERTVTREYDAIVNGVVLSGGSVDAPIGRHPRVRTRMAVVKGGRSAVTHYRVLQRFRAHTHLRLKLETGRTHQIRVHMAHIGHPLLGDPVYGGRLRLPRAACGPLVAALRSFRRQALHASRLTLIHPVSGKTRSWESPLPDDMQLLLAALAADQYGTEGDR
jgi:23S rRNA pseudouridine1911/1915/1917 synthase